MALHGVRVLSVSGFGGGERSDGPGKIGIRLLVGFYAFEDGLKLIFGLERMSGDILGHGFVDQLVLGAVSELADEVQAGLHILVKAKGGGLFHGDDIR